MFSFFMKKSSPEVAPEQAVEIPPFDFTSAIPSGWGIHVGGDFMDWPKATPIESFDQLRHLIETHSCGDGMFSIVNTTKTYASPKEVFKARFDGSLPPRAHASQLYPGKWDITIDDNQKRKLKFGEPGMGAATMPLVSTENATLILCSFLRENGAIPELPHLTTSRPKRDSSPPGSFYL